MLVLVETWLKESGGSEPTGTGAGEGLASSSGSDTELEKEEPGSLTGQKAEPVGMKFTLFLSGQEKSGGAAACRDLGWGTAKAVIRKQLMSKTGENEETNSIKDTELGGHH